MTATLFVVLVHIELRRARARLYATRTLCQWPKPKKPVGETRGPAARLPHLIVA